MLIGAFQPGEMPVDIELLYANSDDLGWVVPEVQRVRKAGRTPLLTIQPMSGIGHTRDVLPYLGPCLLRYGHEFNGWWYPWSRDPQRFVNDWHDITFTRDAQALPVRMIWCPNIMWTADGKTLTSFGGKDIAPFWPGYLAAQDYLGLDGYNMIAGAPSVSPQQLFGRSLDALFGLASNPVLICETASPRRHSQSAWAKELLRAMRQAGNVAGVCWFNQDKSDGAWALSKASARELLKGAR